METKKWDEVQAGDELPVFSYQVTPETVRAFARAVEDDDPWYQESPFGGAIAPPLFICDDYSRCAIGGGYPVNGTIHTKAEHEMLAPIRSGSVLTVRGKVADMYEKRGRQYMVLETITIDERGIELVRSRNTLMRTSLL